MDPALRLDLFLEPTETASVVLRLQDQATATIEFDSATGPLRFDLYDAGRSEPWRTNRTDADYVTVEGMTAGQTLRAEWTNEGNGTLRFALHIGGAFEFVSSHGLRMIDPAAWETPSVGAAGLAGLVLAMAWRRRR